MSEQLSIEHSKSYDDVILQQDDTDALVPTHPEVETAEANFSLLPNNISAVLFYLDGDEYYFESLQSLVVSCLALCDRKSSMSEMRLVDDSSSSSPPVLFEIASE